MLPTLDELAFRHRAPALVLVASPLAWAALALSPPQPLERGLGAALVLAGGALRLMAVRRLGKRARVSRARAERLVHSGPYGWLRNPLYLAALAVIAGAGLLVGLGPWAALPALCGWLLYDRAVRHEERTLVDVQGQAAVDYLRAVPRWVPRPWRPGCADPHEPPVPWREVLSREWRLVLWLPVLIAATLLLSTGPARTVSAHAASLGPWLPVAVGALALAGAVGNALRTRSEVARRARRRAAQLAAEQAPLDLPVNPVGVAEPGVQDGASPA